MPSSQHRIPPQTSKKARRAYLKANKHFEFTPTQARASERRLELDKRAKALRVKEQRKRDNKRKREEKEATERDAKRKRIESGKAPIETLWGKIRASQLRLNTFFAQPKATDNKEELLSESEDEGNSEYDYGFAERSGGNITEHEAQDSVAETEGLEDFFSSATSADSNNMVHAPESNTGEALPQLTVDHARVEAQDVSNTQSSPPPESHQALLDAQLSLSQGIFDFDIAEDDDAEWMPRNGEEHKRSTEEQSEKAGPRLLATPSKRKSEEADIELASPVKSARSALSEMSPSRVNIRAQEKPDIFSVAPFHCKLPTPSPAKPAGCQTAEQVLALIATQDLQDDEFLTDKENEDPWQAEPRKLAQDADSSVNKRAPPGGNFKPEEYAAHDGASEVQDQCPAYDEDIFDDMESGLDDELDEYDNDLDDEAFAALATQSPSAQKLALFSTQNTALTANRDPKAAKEFTTSIAPLGEEGPPEPIPPLLPSRSKTDEGVASRRRQYALPVTQGNSFCFDDLPDDDLVAFAEELDAGELVDGHHAAIKAKPSRTIPWKDRSQIGRSQCSPAPLSQDEDAPFD